MLSNAEKRFVITPTSFLPRNREHAKKQLEKKITKTAEDVGLLIDGKYDISEIIDSIVQHSDIQVKHIMGQILRAQEILDGLGEGGETTPTTITTTPKKTNDSEKPDDDEEKWDL